MWYPQSQNNNIPLNVDKSTRQIINWVFLQVFVSSLWMVKNDTNQKLGIQEVRQLLSVDRWDEINDNVEDYQGNLLSVYCRDPGWVEIESFSEASIWPTSEKPYFRLKYLESDTVSDVFNLGGNTKLATLRMTLSVRDKSTFRSHFRFFCPCLPSS